MKTMRAVLPCLGVLVVLVFATTFASASPTNCATVASCGFGTAVATDAGTLSGSGHAAHYTETVYKNGSVYTYVFTITNNNTKNLDFANTFTNVGGFGDNFNCGDGSCLKYGVITSTSTNGAAGENFAFNPNSLQVGFKSLGNNGTFTFYAQGGAPTSGEIYAGNMGPTGLVPSLDPASEPGVLTLLGSSLMLLFGIPFVRRFQPRDA